ncbi:sigma-54-dependent transcriptional regulator [Desulfonatronum thioautotrophicum]|uniref:sigma-54-dependent transcriptional regulator n=1 Tax=Desulfonatronum thioautotrophicum TaxID=617001 RepID=UPI0005EBC0CA|nr:sigma-54 dependent transcriptional regulator [Desulfonatronum thioautotrophicum]
MAQIVIVDDEADIRTTLRGILEDEGHEVLEAASGEQGVEVLAEADPDLCFLDIWLPGMDGLEVLEHVHGTAPHLPMIMISGHGNIETAVAAIKKGAFDFIEKPLSLEKVLVTTAKAIEFKELRQENMVLRSQIRITRVRELTGETPQIQQLQQQVRQVAPTEAWVLITGENGTGKEIVARSLHQFSHRGQKPLVEVNCAAIPEELIESELFGHERGAFTSADRSQVGKFELAHGGTLFLDEIGDMSLKTQAKILRILQEQRFERVGGRKTIQVDVRVIAATNKNLPEEIRAGRFREDLYYRLKVFPLHVPPLRRRVADIPLLLADFMEGLTKTQGFKPLRFPQETMSTLQRYPWPGNVRELKNFLERLCIMYPGQVIQPDMLPPEMLAPECFSGCGCGGILPEGDWPVDFKAARAQFEAKFLEDKLNGCNGSVTRLAETIGMERSYLYKKLRTLGLLTSD